MVPYIQFADVDWEGNPVCSLEVYVCVCRICSVTFMFVALYVCVICNPLLVYLSVLCNLPVLPICEVVLCIIPARNFFLVFIVCLSVVSRWAHADYLRDCIVHCDTHTHTHNAGRGASALVVSVSLVNLLCSGFPTRCGYRTSSRLFLSLFFPLSSLPPCLFVFWESEREREVCF